MRFKHHVKIVPYLKELTRRAERGEISLRMYAGGVAFGQPFEGEFDDLHQLYYCFLVPAVKRGVEYRGILIRTTTETGETFDAVKVYTEHHVKFFVLMYVENSPSE